MSQWYPSEKQNEIMKHEQLALIHCKSGQEFLVKWWKTCEQFGDWTYPGCNMKVGVYSIVGEHIEAFFPIDKYEENKC